MPKGKIPEGRLYSLIWASEVLSFCFFFNVLTKSKGNRLGIPESEYVVCEQVSLSFCFTNKHKSSKCSFICATNKYWYSAVIFAWRIKNFGVKKVECGHFWALSFVCTCSHYNVERGCFDSYMKRNKNRLECRNDKLEMKYWYKTYMNNSIYKLCVWLFLISSEGNTHFAPFAPRNVNVASNCRDIDEVFLFHYLCIAGFVKLSRIWNNNSLQRSVSYASYAYSSSNVQRILSFRFQYE